MKKLIVTMLSFLIVIGLMVAIKDSEAMNYSLEKVNEAEVLDFSKKVINKDQNVGGELYSPLKNKKGESVIIYGNQIFLTGDYSLIVLDTVSKDKNVISFSYFQPLELVIENNLLYVIGVFDSLKNIVVDENHTFLYDNYECQVSIYDIDTMTEINYLRFNNGYYASSFIIGKTIILSVHINGIINEEKTGLIYPYYENNKQEKVYLSQDQLYLSRNNYFIDSLIFIVKIDIESNDSYEIGLIGVEGIEKNSESKLLIASTIYDAEEPLTVVYIIDFLKDIEYRGYVVVKGSVYSGNSFGVYNNHLRIITINYLNENMTNTIYNINLNNMYFLSSLELSLIDDIALTDFHINSGYISSYNVDSPFYIIDFSSSRININEEYNFDFVGEQLVYGQTSFDIVGRKINAKKMGTAICIASFNLLTNKITRKLIKSYSNVEFDGLLNQNSTVYYDEKVFISFLSNGYQKVLIAKKEKQFLFEKIISVSEYCRRIIINNGNLYAIGFNKIYEYSLSNYKITNTFLVE